MSIIVGSAGSGLYRLYKDDLQPIHGAAHPMDSFVKNVGIDVLVAKQVLDGPNVIPLLQQVRRKRLAGVQGFAKAFREFWVWGGPMRTARVSSNLVRRE